MSAGLWSARTVFTPLHEGFACSCATRALLAWCSVPVPARPPSPTRTLASTSSPASQSTLARVAAVAQRARHAATTSAVPRRVTSYPLPSLPARAHRHRCNAPTLAGARATFMSSERGSANSDNGYALVLSRSVDTGGTRRRGVTRRGVFARAALVLGPLLVGVAAAAPLTLIRSLSTRPALSSRATAPSLPPPPAAVPPPTNNGELTSSIAAADARVNANAGSNVHSALRRRPSSPAALSTDADYVAAYCTVPDTEVGQRVVSELVSSKLAACVNTVPGVQSSYWWEGRVETDSELLLIIKTKRALRAEVVEAIQQVHSYDVPEVIFLPIEAGLSSYMQWLGESTKKPTASSP